MSSDRPTAAASLLAVPQRVYRDFLSPEEHASLLDWTLENRDRFKPATINGGHIDPSVRQSLSLRDLGTSDGVFRERIGVCLPEWIQALRVTRFEPGHVELELVAHNHGAHFAFHADTYVGAGKRHGHRMLSCVYYFHREPKGFSGGALRVHCFGAPEASEGYTDIPPDQNTLVVFPSWAPHEVRRIECPSRDFADSRFAVNCWVYRAQPA